MLWLIAWFNGLMVLLLWVLSMFGLQLLIVADTRIGLPVVCCYWLVVWVAFGVLFVYYLLIRFAFSV